MNSFELLPENGTISTDNTHVLVWPSASSSSETIRTNIDPWLSQLGNVSNGAIDLVRIAAGAFLADRLARRGEGFCRSLRLRVHLIEPSLWLNVAGDMANLLSWLTGDVWELELVRDGLSFEDTLMQPIPDSNKVSLLSGGLDSYCGAVLNENDPNPTIYLGHWDNSIVKASQNRVKKWIVENIDKEFNYFQIRLSQIEKKKEATGRARSILFFALGVALADSANAITVAAPENGFTSINPPLGPERGGALSTRSTHPITLDRVNRILEKIGLRPRVENPYISMTKGELLRTAFNNCSIDIVKGSALTLSCGKLDGRIYKGGNPNSHCGLCLPCIVRRGSYLAADIPDNTDYLSKRLSGKALKYLINRRADDIAAIKHFLDIGLNDTAIFAQGPYPEDIDLDDINKLCKRGLLEISSVPLP